MMLFEIFNNNGNGFFGVCVCVLLLFHSCINIFFHAIYRLHFRFSRVSMNARMYVLTFRERKKSVINYMWQEL